MQSYAAGSHGSWFSSVGQVSRAGFLLPLLAIDLVFIGGHLLRWGEAWRLDLDGGWGERWGYVKEAAIAVALLVVYRRSRQPIYAAWAAVFAYVLADDALMLHERGGKALARLFDFQPMFGLRFNDWGELLVSAVAGSLLLAVSWLAFQRSDATARWDSKILLGLFVVLVFFGVVVDMAHIALASAGFHVRMLVLEDGGELLALSLTAAYAFHLMRQPVAVSGRQR